MRRLLLVALLALTVVGAAGAGTAGPPGWPVTVTVSPGRLELDVTGAPPGTEVAASCVLNEWRIGTGKTPVEETGEVTVQVLYPSWVVGDGPFYCWVRSGDTFSANAITLSSGYPAVVAGKTTP